ncbi:hypothetical protein BX265_7633 [Streptomyces sp. TLI_235]|nr:hypothetical protein [Streptomyces sp. TLI_235]PBC70237.1 hypothetical protein BX265_7633 [Streptomyces sp. TLI_235]
MPLAPLTVPAVPVPPAWAALLADWPADTPGTLLKGLRAARDTGLLADLDSATETADFRTSLADTLAGPSRCAAVTLPGPGLMLAVVSVLGDLLGRHDHPASATLGGPVSEVPTGGVDRYEQTWHTDSTPWALPNRWTILGLLREDPELHEPATSVLPWAFVDEDRADGGVLPSVLRHEEVSWRTRYPGLAPLHAPVRGEVPRWFRPALDAFLTGGTPGAAAGRELERRLAAVPQWYEAVVAPARVLVFDNHAALHRGPAIPRPSARTLLRFKVGGLPETPLPHRPGDDHRPGRPGRAGREADAA